MATLDLGKVVGESATITVGSTTTLQPGSDATVENVGTSTNAILNFGIPKGEDGEAQAETDPIFTASASYGITSEDINNWNNKADMNDIPDVSNFITKDVNNLTYYTLATATGSTIELSINSSTYVMTLNLKNSAGTTISTGTVDLPLESVVVSGAYDDTTKKIILTLQSGSTVEFSVADLVSGLQSEITSSNKLSADLVDDTNATNKFTNATEKSSWNAKYDKPSGGIPDTDLSSAVQTSLGKADTALQSETYTGTITSVKMNGSTIASSGEADLGTVLTQHQSIKTINSTSLVGTGDVAVQETLVSGTNIKTINNTSLLGSGNISISGGTATDVQINGTSITSNNEANIITKTAYDSSTNKIVTESDLPDISGKQDKETITTNTSATTATLALTSNNEYRYTQNLTSLTITLPASIDNDFIAWVVFNSGSTATTFNAPNTIKFSGDDVASNTFTPVASKTYNIGFWYDGINTNAVVRGA